MNHPHEDVILDLVPLYFAGDASAATRTLVESYFATHPQFAAAMRAAQDSAIAVPGSARANSGTAAIHGVRQRLMWRAALIAIGIFCSLTPFSFIYENGVLRYFMWRDSTPTALMFATAAAIAWTALILLGRRNDA